MISSTIEAKQIRSVSFTLVASHFLCLSSWRMLKIFSSCLSGFLKVLVYLSSFLIPPSNAHTKDVTLHTHKWCYYLFHTRDFVAALPYDDVWPFIMWIYGTANRLTNHLFRFAFLKKRQRKHSLTSAVPCVLCGNIYVESHKPTKSSHACTSEAKCETHNDRWTANSKDCMRPNMILCMECGRSTFWCVEICRLKVDSNIPTQTYMDIMV